MGKHCWSQAVLESGSWGHSVLQTPALVIRSLEPLGPFNRFGYFKSILFLDSVDLRYLEEKQEEWGI